MTTPILEIKTASETQLLYGSGARFVAESDCVVTARPIDNNAVTIRVARCGHAVTLNGGYALSTTLAAGDIIDII
jgi:hypothetical protein